MNILKTNTPMQRHATASKACRCEALITSQSQSKSNHHMIALANIPLFLCPLLQTGPSTPQASQGCITMPDLRLTQRLPGQQDSSPQAPEPTRPALPSNTPIPEPYAATPACPNHRTSCTRHHTSSTSSGAFTTSHGNSAASSGQRSSSCRGRCRQECGCIHTCCTCCRGQRGMG